LNDETLEDLYGDAKWWDLAAGCKDGAESWASRLLRRLEILRTGTDDLLSDTPSQKSKSSAQVFLSRLGHFLMDLVLLSAP